MILSFSISVFLIQDTYAASLNIESEEGCNSIGGVWTSDDTNVCSIVSLTITNLLDIGIPMNTTLKVGGILNVTQSDALLAIGTGGNLIVESAGTLETHGNVFNSGTVINNGSIESNDELTNKPNGILGNNGIISINSGGFLASETGSITNNNFGGIININSGGTYTSDGYSTNSGTINNSWQFISGNMTNNNSGVILNNAGHITAGRDFINDGEITNLSGCTLPTNSVDNFSTFGNFINNGVVTNQANCILDIKANFVFNFTNNGIVHNDLGILKVNNYIYNLGTLNNTGSLTNTYIINNNSTGLIINNGTLSNQSLRTIDNDGIIKNYKTITNGGTINNKNSALLDNFDFINNLSTITNSGTINNQCNAVIQNNQPTGNPVNNIACPGPCAPPVSGDWIVTSSCTLSTSSAAPADVIVQNGVVLTIPNSMTLDIDFANFNLTVESGSGVLIKQGGTIT